MKEGLHPKYQQVLFVDTSKQVKWLCGSTITSNKTEQFEGKEYPVVYLSTSSASHPFFTNEQRFLDSEGRLDKFVKKYAKNKQDFLEATKVPEVPLKKKNAAKVSNK
jgi:large subunit ribosomal protein L31